MALSVSREDLGAIRVIACIGTMTLTGGADDAIHVFEQALTEGRGGIVLDLTRVTYIDSAGVGAVVACAKRAAAEGVILKIALAPAGPVQKIFEITQLTRGLSLYEDTAAAAASFS